MSHFAVKNNTARVAVFFSLSQKSLSQFNCLRGLSLKNGKYSSVETQLLRHSPHRYLKCSIGLLHEV